MCILYLILLGLTLAISQTQKTAVLILARGGSKGIRLKNLQEVGGLTLLGRAILTAQHAGFTDITISTDNPLIALEALKYKVHLFKRSPVTASDWAPSIWGASEFIESRPDVNVLLLLQVTSPFIQAKHLSLALNKLNYPKPFDCIFSVTRSHKLRWNCKNFTPINFNTIKRPRRQDWLGEFVETGAFYMARANLVKEGLLQNNNCTVWEVAQQDNFEIDTYFDILLADLLIKNKL